MRATGFVVAVVTATLVATGCSGSISERRKIDYKSAKRLPPLEVPPDLVTPENNERFIVSGEGEATYSDYSRARDAARSSEQQQVLPDQQGMRVEGVGDFRWLVVDAAPEALWQPLREFWQESGFLIARESPETGVMETDWAENRAKIPDSLIRRGLSFVGFDRAYSSPERDKFRTRIERGEEPGTSEIFISHRGVYQAVKKEGSGDRQSTIWQARPRDPELEAEMLYRLMARLGGSQAEIEQARAMPEPAPRAQLSSGADDPTHLELRDPFDQAWRRVGLALDYVGFTVEDRDRSQGVYFVRYNDPDATEERSGLARLAFWRDEEPVNQKYRIRVSSAGDESSEVHVLDESGTALATSTASRILGLLRDQLR